LRRCRGRKTDRPNQVWAADITYLPIGRGFLYLVAVMDWSSRAVPSWRLSNTMDVLQSVNRKHVQRLMRQMGIAALGPKPRTTKPAPGHKIFP
jgi:transposase InsO family protein